MHIEVRANETGGTFSLEKYKNTRVVGERASRSGPERQRRVLEAGGQAGRQAAAATAAAYIIDQ